MEGGHPVQNALQKPVPQINIEPWPTRAEPPELCFHGSEASRFGKKWPSLSFKSSDGSKTQEGCIICYANGFRTGISKTLEGYHWVRRNHTSNVAQTAVDNFSFRVGLAMGEKKYQGDEKPLTAKYSGMDQEPNPPHFEVEKKQYGELFHVLLARLFQTGIIITNRDEANGKIGDIFQAFDYYNIKSVSNPQTNGKNKDRATEILGDAFRKNDKDQELLFRATRATLERLNILDISSFESIVPRSPEYYCGVSYLGKYWINRFFTLTEQGTQKRDKQRWKLPNATEVTRMALIYIRKEAPTGELGRSMTDENVTVFLNAIARANSVARNDGQGSAFFSHILFFGDFETRDEAERLQGLVSKSQIQKTIRKDKCLYITKPWMSTSDSQDIADFWAEYQAQGTNEPQGPEPPTSITEGAPLQIKNMAMFFALQARYQEKICAIGLRGGYLDLAGFIGIPTFFVDAAWTTKPNFDLKKLIYLPAENNSRMVRVSNNINTFIRIDFLKTKKAEGVKEEPLWGLTDNGVGERLAAALYVFMLVKVGDQGPLWKQRLRLLNEEVAQGGKGTLQELVEGFIESEWR